MTNLEVLTLFMTFIPANFRELEVIEQFVNRLVEAKFELSEDEIDKVVSVLAELNYRNTKKSEEFIDSL